MTTPIFMNADDTVTTASPPDPVPLDAVEQDGAGRAAAMRYIIAFGDLQGMLGTFEALGRAAAHALLDAAGEYSDPAAMYASAGRALADWARTELHASNLRCYCESGLPEDHTTAAVVLHEVGADSAVRVHAGVHAGVQSGVRARGRAVYAR